MCNSHLSSKKLIFTANKDCYRKPQLDKTRDPWTVGESSPVDTSTSQFLHLWLSKYDSREGTEIVGERIPVSLL